MIVGWAIDEGDHGPIKRPELRKLDHAFAYNIMCDVCISSLLLVMNLYR